MNVAITIVWRPTPERQLVHDHVVSLYRWAFPGVPVVDVDTGHDPFNRAAVRNECVRQAEEAGAEIVVISDADAVFAPVSSLCEAIASAPDGRLHLPYTAQHYCTEDETARIINGDRTPLPGHHGTGACYVITPAAWRACGGCDERFIGWGGEDDALVSAANALIGVERHLGTVLSLWHADERRPVGSDEHRPNKDLADRYHAARSNPTAIRQLIAER